MGSLQRLPGSLLCPFIHSFTHSQIFLSTYYTESNLTSTEIDKVLTLFGLVFNSFKNNKKNLQIEFSCIFFWVWMTKL